MTALQIVDIKSFMKKFLLTDSFDRFLLLEGSITTFNTFQIDGTLRKSYYSREEQDLLMERSLSLWGEVRPFCLELIKGKRTPLHFRFVMHLLPEKATALLVKNGCDVDPSLVRALVLNIRYDGSKAVLTTGTAYQTFVPSKEPDIIWDKALAKYLDGKGIACESL